MTALSMLTQKDTHTDTHTDTGTGPGTDRDRDRDIDTDRHTRHLIRELLDLCNDRQQQVGEAHTLPAALHLLSVKRDLENVKRSL